MIGYVDLCKGYMTKEMKSFAVGYMTPADLLLFESDTEQHL